MRKFKHVLILASSLCWPASAAAAPVPSCFPPGGFETQGVRAKTAREIALNPKETLLLAGIDIPEGVEARALSRVGELVAGKKLRYAPLAPSPDRYGRLVAEAAAQDVWLQGTLVEEGLAVAMPVGFKTACAAELLSAERTARQKKAGIWSLAGAAIAAADREALQRAAGRFAIVEGRVSGVRARDYATFINFGRDYRQDFALIVVKKHVAALEAKQALSTLAGKRVRVRGLVEAQPPRLRLEEPLALEVLE